MNEDKSIGLKVAENPREALIVKSIENYKTTILNAKLQIEVDEKALEFLKSQVKK